jgi:ketosteroid isomerase-like protein
MTAKVRPRGVTNQVDDAGLSVAAPEPGDIEAITEIARAYIEGWFDGDEERMRRCLHPDLVKRTIYRDPKSGEWGLGRPSTAEMMVGWTRDGEGRTTVARERAFEIEVQDVFRHIAAVRVLSYPYMDYLHVAKIGNRWLIVNVLWELREGEMPPPKLDQARG